MPNRFKPLPVALLAATLLTACGDGTPAPGINTDEDGETGAARDTTPRNITPFRLRDSTGSTTNSLSVLRNPVTLSFTAVDAQGDPVGGASGRYSIQVPAGGRQLFDGTFTADESGEVSIGSLSLDDPTVGGTGQLQVRFTIEGSASRAAPPQPFTVAQQSGIPVSFDLDLLRDALRSDSDITSISTDNPGFVVARMRDYQNVPVNDQIVTMETDTGTVQGNGRALSDADGRATARLEVGMDTPGSAGTVTVTVQGRSSGEGEEPDWRLDPQQLNFAIVERGAVSTAGYQIAVALHSSSTTLDDSTKVAAVDLLRPTFAVVTVTSSSDDPVADLVIAVEIPEDIVTVTPASGRALTNAAGIAFVELRAEAADAREVGTLSATVAGTEVQAELNFTVGSLDLKLGRDNNGFANAGDIDFAEGEIDTGLATGAELAAAGTTLLRVVAVAADAETQGADTPLTINFESDCTRAGTATIDSPVTAVRGIATATYNAAG
ncbi:MAG: hypothetical protein GDA55_08205, partial [Cellvibrionales bacterium]|nr:hypothetical protein [Cellvibrionales bacterium]